MVAGGFATDAVELGAVAESDVLGGERGQAREGEDGDGRQASRRGAAEDEAELHHGISPYGTTRGRGMDMTLLGWTTGLRFAGRICLSDGGQTMWL